MQVSFSTQPEIYAALKRLAESQERSLSQVIHIICKERVDLCQQERRATGTTSLYKKQKQAEWDAEAVKKFGSELQ